jgi:hypothetical protein
MTNNHNNNHKQNKEQGKFFPSLTFLLLILSPLFGFSCGPSSSLPSSSFNKPSEEIKEEEPKQETSEKIPEGWKVYESKTLSLSFAYPPDWYVKEDEKLGILLSDKPLPERLGPDVIGVPIVIGMSEESEVEYEEKLRTLDPQLIIEEIKIDNHSGKRYSSLGVVSEEDEPGISYRFPLKEGFLEIAINTHTDETVVQSLLNSLSF